MSHIHDKMDFVVETFVVYNNKVLLRVHDKLNIWLSVGGHIELDEDPVQAAVREVKEEVGLDIELYDEEGVDKFEKEEETIIIRPQYISRHKITDTHEHVALIYFARSFTDKVKPSETEKSDGIKWFSKEELDDPKYDIKPIKKFFAKKAIEKLAD